MNDNINNINVSLSNDELELLISMRDQFEQTLWSLIEDDRMRVKTSVDLGVGDIPRSYPVVESKIAVLNKVIDAASETLTDETMKNTIRTAWPSSTIKNEYPCLDRITAEFAALRGATELIERLMNELFKEYASKGLDSQMNGYEKLRSAHSKLMFERVNA